MKLVLTLVSLLTGASVLAQLPKRPPQEIYATSRVVNRPANLLLTNRPDSLRVTSENALLRVTSENALLRVQKDSVIDQSKSLLLRTEHIHSQDRVIIDELTQTVLQLRDRLGQTGSKRP